MWKRFGNLKLLVRKYGCDKEVNREKERNYHPASGSSAAPIDLWNSVLRAKN